MQLQRVKMKSNEQGYSLVCFANLMLGKYYDSYINDGGTEPEKTFGCTRPPIAEPRFVNIAFSK